MGHKFIHFCFKNICIQKDGKYSLKTHIHIVRYGGLYQIKNPKTHAYKVTTHITCKRTIFIRLQLYR